MRQSLKNYKRIVVKIGSSLMSGEDTAIAGITNQISSLVESGKEVVVVSSGAIASGMRVLKMKSRPKELSGLQAAAAVGQHILMSRYHSFFEKKGLTCAQVLLTRDDFNDRGRYLNAKNTLLELLRLKSIPIVNENDSVSTDEIKFGDNDSLSALVAGLVKADILIILSDVEGLLDKEKRVIRLVDKITAQIKGLACPTDKSTCVGGMITKIEAAGIATDSGIPCVIASGQREGVILSLLENPYEAGTWFLPGKNLGAREHWIAFGTKPKASIVVDDGAKRALIDKKSLLAVGVAASVGNFAVGDIVSVKDKSGVEFARGKTGVSASQLQDIKGRRYPKEIIHRDNIVIL